MLTMSDYWSGPDAISVDFLNLRIAIDTKIMCCDDCEEFEIEYDGKTNVNVHGWTIELSEAEDTKSSDEPNIWTERLVIRQQSHWKLLTVSKLWYFQAPIMGSIPICFGLLMSTMRLFTKIRYR